MRWLIPRLPSFQAKWPSVELRLATTSARIDFARDGFDVAIRSLPKGFARTALAKDQAWRDLVATPFLVETMFPVASPRLLGRAPGLRTPADLRHYTLLHSLSVPQAWVEWLRAAGVVGIDAEAGPSFDHFYFALQAAAQGLGVAMATEPCLGQDLETGVLAAPFPKIVIRMSEYHLIYPRRLAVKPPLKAFCDWIMSVAQGETNPSAKSSRRRGATN
jgi:LysR family glycine cleavage system transcriptional activator